MRRSQSQLIKPTMGDMLMDHREFARGRGTTIQAGLFAGLAGHSSGLKVRDGGARVVYSSLTLPSPETFHLNFSEPFP